MDKVDKILIFSIVPFILTGITVQYAVLNESFIQDEYYLFVIRYKVNSIFNVLIAMIPLVVVYRISAKKKSNYLTNLTGMILVLCLILLIGNIFLISAKIWFMVAWIVFIIFILGYSIHQWKL